MFKFYKKNKKSIKIKNEYDSLSSKKKITFFTGAGISKESGLETFRDSDGLWNNHRVEDVATASALKHNFSTVIDFYNSRRREMISALPNKAHTTIKSLEEIYDIAVVTQNVDNLHEKAGSTSVVHLHGEILKSRPISNSKILHEQLDDIKVDQRCPITNSRLRPHIVLFNEQLYEDQFNLAKKHIRQSDIIVVIGTSLQVFPAAGLITEANPRAVLYVINPDDDFNEIYYRQFYSDVIHFQDVATEGMLKLEKILTENQNLS